MQLPGLSFWDESSKVWWKTLLSLLTNEKQTYCLGKDSAENVPQRDHWNYPENYIKDHYRSQYSIFHIFTWKEHKIEFESTWWGLKSFTLMQIIIYLKNISHSYLISNLITHLGYLLHLVIQAQTADWISILNKEVYVERNLMTGRFIWARFPSWTAREKNTYFWNIVPSSINRIHSLTWFTNCGGHWMVFLCCLVLFQFTPYILLKKIFLGVNSKNFSWKLLEQS